MFHSIVYKARSLEVSDRPQQHDPRRVFQGFFLVQAHSPGLVQYGKM